MKLTENRKKQLTLLVALPALLLALGYAGGYVSQFIINYRIWTSSGGTPGNGTSPAFPDSSLGACFRTLTVFPYSLYGIALCTGILGLLIFMVMRMGFGRKGTYDKERNLTYSNQGTYGTSGFMTDSEMRGVLEVVSDIAGNRGVILGKLYGKAVCLPEKTRMNRNVAVFGASGSMKSRAYARNVVFQCVKRGESLIITDPKSELYADMCLYLEENGYTVRVFNLINPENSDSWNRTGEVSVAVSSQAKQLNTWRVSDYTPEYRETHSVGKRKLMTADEVLRLPLDEALIILRGQKVLKVGKFDYTLHPESKKLRECRASDHVPAWRRLPETEEPDFSRLMTPKPKPKAPRKKPVPEKPVSGNPYPETPDIPPAAPTHNEDCKIVMTDKKSIMS